MGTKQNLCILNEEMEGNLQTCQCRFFMIFEDSGEQNGMGRTKPQQQNTFRITQTTKTRRFTSTILAGFRSKVCSSGQCWNEIP